MYSIIISYAWQLPWLTFGVTPPPPLQHPLKQTKANEHREHYPVFIAKANRQLPNPVVSCRGFLF